MALPRQRDPHEYVPLSPHTALSISGEENEGLVSYNTTKQTLLAEYAPHLVAAILAAGQSTKEST